MDNKGLTEKEAIESRIKFGENVLPTNGEKSWLVILWSQLKSPLVYILLVTAVISLFLKEYIDAGLMSLVVLFNLLMGFIQENRAQKTLTALKKI